MYVVSIFKKKKKKELCFVLRELNVFHWCQEGGSPAGVCPYLPTVL